jgi:hypothetical protein
MIWLLRIMLCLVLLLFLGAIPASAQGWCGGPSSWGYSNGCSGWGGGGWQSYGWYPGWQWGGPSAWTSGCGGPCGGPSYESEWLLVPHRAYRGQRVLILKE